MKKISKLKWLACLVIALVGFSFASCSKDDEKKEPATLEVTGKIVSSKDGKSVSGANISLGDNTAKSNSSGSFKLSEVKPGSYSLVVKATGYENYEDNITIPEKSSYDIQLSQVLIRPQFQ